MVCEVCTTKMHRMQVTTLKQAAGCRNRYRHACGPLRMTMTIHRRQQTTYKEIFRKSIEKPDQFWYEAAQAIEWHRAPTQQGTMNVQKNGFAQWFVDGELNTCYNMLDRHVANGKGEQPAIIYDSPMLKKIQKFTYRQVLDEVMRLAGAMRHAGVEKGDRVVIYMPSLPQALFAMMATARLGAIHSVVFGGFAGPELAKRISDAQPKLIFTTSCGIEGATKVLPYMPMVREALDIVKIRPTTLVWQRDTQRAELMASDNEYDWQDYVDRFGSKVDPVPVKATDPLYILYTSGTTGMPKGVQRDNGGHAVALKFAMKNLFASKPGEAFWSASDIGWVVGHSFIVYGPLLNGNTTILYEGKPIGTPDAGAFWRVVHDHRVVRMFTAPTAIRAIKKEDPEGKLVGKYDVSSLTGLYLAGERADPNTVDWIVKHLKTDVIDNYWQTESGWSIVSNPAGIELMPIKYGSSTLPVPGYDVQVLDDLGKRLTEPEQPGNLVVKLPLPPGALQTLWNDEERFEKSYLRRFPGYYDTSDAGHIDADGYVWVMSRTDDVINTAGHRLSSGSLEEVLSSHPAIAEAAVVGVYDSIKGEVPVGFAVLKSGRHDNLKELEKELVQAVRHYVGAVASLRHVIFVQRLPKTRSGKILRNVIRALCNDTEVKVPPTVEDASVVDEIHEVIKTATFRN